jgi:hypothetical protein
MMEQNPHLESIEDIRQLMHKSSRFISLSGWSGVAAGSCALVAAWLAKSKIHQYQAEKGIDASNDKGTYIFRDGYKVLEQQLITIAAITFVAALILAFVFTYLRSRKTGVPIWGYTARRVMVNVAVPMTAGGLVIWRMIDVGIYGLVAPVSLIFYGLALINASKYTLKEIKYLGYGQLLLGIVNLWLPGFGIYFWAVGFGLLHIIYGIVMWNKYERNQ